MKNYYYNIVFQAIKLIYNFPSINWHQKLMKKDTLTEAKEKKQKDKKKQKKNLVINLLELILMKRIMISIVNLVKQPIILVNQIKNQIRSL